MITPPKNIFTVSTVLFHKDGGANVAVTDCMSHFSMFVPTKYTVKLANGMDHLLEFLHSEHDEYILDVDLQMLHYLMVVAPSFKILYSIYCVVS